jgi:putative oxidoreductase
MFQTWCRDTLVPLVLRVGLAAIFLFHGANKITGRGRQWGANWHYTGPPRMVPGPRGAPRTVAADALPAPVQLAVAWGEFVGGLALLLGFLTRVAAAGLAVIMIGAIVTVTGENGFPLLDEAGKWNGGFEYNFAVLVLCAAAVLAGGGRLAVDRVLFGRRPPAVTAAPRLEVFGG